MIYAALYLVLFSDLRPDVIIADQISACIPVLKVMSRARIVFYCHFPDQLLTQRKSWAKRLYRKPIDWLEEITTGMADKVLVNSKFTGMFLQIFLQSFPKRILI
jgi:alpha-1,3/alpha-1,6-mannosyltransferase